MATNGEDEQDEELFEHYRIVADAGQTLLRIDKFLMDRLPNVTRTRVQDGIHAGFVRVNEKTIKPNHKIHPGDAIDKNLYELPPEELRKVPTVCGSLREALNCLDADRSFLTKGGVFTDDQIDGYMELKWEEVYNWEHQPTPIEYKMYYSI